MLKKIIILFLNFNSTLVVPQYGRSDNVQSLTLAILNPLFCNFI